MSNTSLEKYVEQSQKDAAPLKTQSAAFLKRAKDIVVADEGSLKQALTMKKEIQKQTKSVAEMRKQLTQPLDNVKKQLMMLEQDVMVDLDEAKTYIGDQILAYEEEKERKRAAEAERVAVIVNDLTCTFGPNSTVDMVKDLMAKLKAYYKDLAPADQTLPEVKQAFLQTVSNADARIATIQEEQKRKEEDERLKKIAAEQSVEAARIAKEKSDNEAERRRIERERAELENQKRQQALENEKRQREAEAAKADKAAPKSNIVSTFQFEVVNADLIPRAYLSPDDKKIGEAIRQSKGQLTIPGVKVTEKKITR